MSARRKLITVLILIFALIGVCYILLFIHSCSYRKSWEKKTSPLPQSTTSMLCKKLLLDNSNALCNDSKDVYALDFDEAVRQRFPLDLENTSELPKNKATIIYEEVSNVIGEFEVECQEVVHLSASGYSYFRCFYDLRGDGYWIMTFYFYYPEETLFSIQSGTEDD